MSMNFKRALRALDARQEARIALGLGRMRRHLQRLGDPHKGLRVLHIAGTNGKGSVCAILESVLRQAGYKTGFYSSPHVENIRERIKAGGRQISEQDFARLLERALKADREGSLTYFELMTSAAFQYFAEKKVDVTVLETGLGGRLDATNVVERPLASIITSIDFDHVQYLGNTLSKIAAEKAGIIKRRRPVFCGALPPAALKTIRARAQALKAPAHMALRPFHVLKTDWRGNRQTMANGDGRRFDLSLLGAKQGKNAALARAVLDGLAAELSVSDAAWRKGLSEVAWPGRFEVRRLGAKTAVLDGAHNPEAIRNFRRTWEASPFARERVRWIIGIMKDKDALGMIRTLAPLMKEVVTVRPPSPRAIDSVALAQEVRRLAPRARVTVERDPETAARAWLAEGARSPRTAVFCGSFYLVGSASRVLGGARG